MKRTPPPRRVLRARRHVQQQEARESIVRVQQVICGPVRLRIIQALETSELSVGELAAAIGCKTPVASQHLRILRALGMVEGERRQRTVTYRLLPGPVVTHLQGVLEAMEQEIEATG